MRRRPLFAVLCALLLAGCGAGAHPPYATSTPPGPGPEMQAAACPTGNDHTMGECLPHPKPSSRHLGLSPRQTVLGCDLSNNNPVYGLPAWRAIAAHMSWCYLKVNESGFIDPTAGAMAAYAHAVGLPVGGYDFQHVCQGSPQAEAQTFVSAARRDRLLGPATLDLVGDVEYPPSTGSCNARAWESAWNAEVRRLTGEPVITYTGAWWWNPHLGCFWPGGKDWISGYGVNFPFLPICHKVLDVWQDTDHGFNGASFSDTSVWYAGPRSLEASIVPAPAPPKIYCFGRRYRPRDHARVCDRIRPETARRSRARDASRRALASTERLLRERRCARPYRRKRCRPLARAAAVFAQRERYFEKLVRDALRTYS